MTPSADILDKLKGIVRDRVETWVMLAAMLFFATHISVILWKRAAQIKDFENTLSWLLSALVIVLITFVAGEVAQKPKRKSPKLPTLGDTPS